MSTNDDIYQSLTMHGIFSPTDFSRLSKTSTGISWGQGTKTRRHLGSRSMHITRNAVWTFLFLILFLSTAGDLSIPMTTEKFIYDL